MIRCIFLLSLGFMTLTHSIPARSQTGRPPADTVLAIPLGGNAWSSAKNGKAGRVTDQGIQDWTRPETRFYVYIRVSGPGTLKLSVPMEVPSGTSRLGIRALGHRVLISNHGRRNALCEAGSWQVPDSGYVLFVLQGISRTGPEFARIASIQVQEKPASMRLSFVPTNQGQYFYWGKRGPSVHLRYLISDSVNVRYFYNEVTVPKGDDVQGSYFMADGFAQGYFGMQVNGPATRHILFSVWSPYQSNHPEDIPDSLRIRLLRKGPGVHAGAFGNEGSGGQSYLNYPWKAGRTYRFLVQARPVTGNATVFSAWFYAPESGSWRLIASFKRPSTRSYLSHLYSFLENFDPAYGTRMRLALYSNAWACDTKGTWIPLNRAEFTADPTGQLGYRKDYAGGVQGDAFFLKNGGFFSRYTPLNQVFTRPAGKRKAPLIDFDALP